MEGKIVLKGISWNHPRGLEPLEAVTKEFCRQHPQVEIQWDTRSLKAFADYPVTLLAEKYDFISLDHPYIGSAKKAGAILPLDQWLSPEYLEDQKNNSVGRSFESYAMDGHQWALAMDAAAQISAYRPDLMEKIGKEIPKTWEGVFELARSQTKEKRVGIPLCETDVYCCFLSLCANHKGDHFFTREGGPDHEAALYAVRTMSRLVKYVHADSLDMNPVQMLDKMAVTDEIAYVPLIFGYSNYARPSDKGKKLIRFANIPSETGVPSGALLGGVGLAVSSRCREKEIAVEFVKMTVSAKVQKGIYYENAGQPGYLGAWKDRHVNDTCNGFFEDTLDTLMNSYLRPRYEGYNEFQEKAGAILNHGLRNQTAPEEIVKRVEELFESLKKRGD